MANENQKPPDESKPKGDKPKEPSAAELIAAKEKELAELEAKKKLELLQKKIDALNHDPAAQRAADAHAKREKAPKETVDVQDGSRTIKVPVAVYKTLIPSYKARQPGAIVEYLPENTIIRIHADKLPGESMVPAEKAPASEKAAYL